MSKTVQVAVAIIIKQQQVYITRRQQGQHLAGCWEFPGGKIEANETPEQALQRELKEEINLQFSQAQFFESLEFTYPEKNVCLHFYLIRQLLNQPQPQEGQQGKWCPIQQLVAQEFPAANQTIIHKLQQLQP